MLTMEHLLEKLAISPQEDDGMIFDGKEVEG